MPCMGICSAITGQGCLRLLIAVGNDMICSISEQFVL